MSEVEVTFVCWGNICRSPMAERVAQGWAEREGLDSVKFTSFGVSAEEYSNPIDPRARAVLNRAGYSSAGHSARQIRASDIRNAALVVALEPRHRDMMLRQVPDADNIVLLTDFDPDAEPGSGIIDPWYGDASGFNDTLASIESAMPALIEQARDLTAK